MSETEVKLIHFCTDLHLTSKLVNKERCLMVAPLSDQIRSNDRSARLGAIATMVDIAGSDPVLAAWEPDWTATQDITINSISRLIEGPIVVDAKLLRLGKKIIFVSANIYDGNGLECINELEKRMDAIDKPESSLRLTAKSLITFTRISRSGAEGVESYNPNTWVGEEKLRTSGRTNLLMLNDRLGLVIKDSMNGVLEVENTPYLANSIGTINGGAQAVAIEAAAQSMRPKLLCSDIQIHFLSQLKVGPAVTECTVIRDDKDHSVIGVQLCDKGTGKLLASATVLLRNPT